MPGWLPTPNSPDCRGAGVELDWRRWRCLTESASDGQQAAIDTSPLGPLHTGWDPLRRHPKRMEKAIEHFSRSSRFARAVAAKIGVQGAVGEMVLNPVSPVYGQRGLADP